MICDFLCLKCFDDTNKFEQTFCVKIINFVLRVRLWHRVKVAKFKIKVIIQWSYDSFGLLKSTFCNVNNYSDNWEITSDYLEGLKVLLTL